MNEAFTIRILKAFVEAGGQEVCICPASRNAPFVSLLARQTAIRTYTGYEERSMAFFAMGRSRLTNRPVAIITTTGTASAELLPAMMESHYIGTPLVAITVDRPRRFRGTGAPQTCEQPGLFGPYASLTVDVEGNEAFTLAAWDRRSPIQLNICMDEPLTCDYSEYELPIPSEAVRHSSVPFDAKAYGDVNAFLENSEYPLVIVGALKPDARDPVEDFLSRLQAPMYLEATSGLRERSRLQALRIRRTQNIMEMAAATGYPVDGILRIGGVPTVRLWRDLEKLRSEMRVCSVNDVPFPGLSLGSIVRVSLPQFFRQFNSHRSFEKSASTNWRQEEAVYEKTLLSLFEEEPRAEASLLHALSCSIPEKSTLFLGNSLPIREWDLAAGNRPFEVLASRGVNGIDGQLSAFFGMCRSESANWGIFGDLTTLYDMAAPWILPQLEAENIRLVIINNGGGQIFSRMYAEKEFLNAHALSFKPLAEMWKLEYQRWEEIEECETDGRRLIELIPDEASTHRFWEKLAPVREAINVPA